MIFSTPLFVLVFLPLTLAAYYVVAGHRRLRVALLSVASVVFYGAWDVRLVPLLLFSVLLNWGLAWAFGRSGRRGWLTLGVVLDLALLAFFKYADFLATSLLGLLGQGPSSFHILLPLGISFFTFQQIAYLVDLRRGDKRLYSFADYFLFVTYFPQLIAGPIVRHEEIIGQFHRDPRGPGTSENLGRGSMLFLIGLAKKVIFADAIARIGDPLYAAAVGGEVLSFQQAWAAGLAFTLQVYFDFSGYSDMAIGMGRMFGFQLPLNFDAPYRATSISDFWRRWHITLSRFLRDYVYIPLGGNRLGRGRQAVNVVLTMLLGGLWHGAGWTYVVWGGLHGVALAVQGGWERRVRRRMPAWLGWLLTINFFIFTIVLFRAASFSAGGAMAWSMLGGHGFFGIARDDVLLLAAGGLVALLGPTSQVVALQRLRPRAPLAVAAALLFVYLILRMASGSHPEFIYFQF